MTTSWPGSLESPFATPPANAGEYETLPADWLRTAEGERETPAERQRRECAERFKALRQTLPEEMNAALDKGEWSDAVRWGIQHDIRDVNQLTDVVFGVWTGDSRGYCKIQRGEPQFQHWSQLWLRIRDDIVRPAFAFTRPTDKAPPTPCVAHEKRRATPEPERPPLDITGRYEEDRATPRFTLRVNQAGNHVEAMFTQAVLPDADPNVHRRPRGETLVTGDLQHPEAKPYFEVYDRARPAPPALVSVDPGTGTLRVNDPAAKTTLSAKLVSRSPTLLADALSSLDELDLVRLYELRPLTRHQIDHLHRKLQARVLGPLLEKYFSFGDDLTADRVHRGEALRPLLRYLESVWADPQHGIDEQDVELAKFYARSILTLGRYTLAGRLTSLLDWLQLVIDRVYVDNQAVGGGPPTGDFALTRLLGLRPRAMGKGTGNYTYRVSLTMSGGGLFVAGYAGRMTVEKVGGDDLAGWPAGHQEHYSYYVVGLEGGAGIKPYSTITGEATVPFAWLPPDFPGSIEIGKAGVGAFGVSAEGGFVHLHGRGYLPVMPVVYTSLAPNISLHPTQKNLGLGEVDFEIGPAGYLGKVRDRAFPAIDYTTFTVKTDYAVAYDLTRQVHFCLDSAILSAEARRAVRVMCANELPALGSATSHLTVNGHTDRIQTVEYNRELSQLRADNTMQAIRDVLGGRFGIPDSNVHVAGLGEELATKDGRPDGEIYPKYRRVDIILNGRLVLTLSAQ